jgi:hypothetical protein
MMRLNAVSYKPTLKRRNTGNRWFKRCTLYRTAIDVLRKAQAPLTAREITLAVLEGKEPEASR